MGEQFYAVCHINPIKMPSTRCVCITARRGVLQNLDSAQPLAGYFFVENKKNRASAPVSATRIAGFTDFDLYQLGQLGL